MGDRATELFSSVDMTDPDKVVGFMADVENAARKVKVCAPGPDANDRPVEVGTLDEMLEERVLEKADGTVPDLKYLGSNVNRKLVPAVGSWGVPVEKKADKALYTLIYDMVDKDMKITITEKFNPGRGVPPSGSLLAAWVYAARKRPSTTSTCSWCCRRAAPPRS